MMKFNMPYELFRASYISNAKFTNTVYSIQKEDKYEFYTYDGPFILCSELVKQEDSSMGIINNYYNYTQSVQSAEPIQVIPVQPIDEDIEDENVEFPLEDTEEVAE